jgi:hypothetical protein
VEHFILIPLVILVRRYLTKLGKDHDERYVVTLLTDLPAFEADSFLYPPGDLRGGSVRYHRGVLI